MSSRSAHHPVFVPHNGNRRDTAILLLGTAEEFGVPKSDVLAGGSGFYISQKLADVLYSETEQEPEVPAKRSRSRKKASGNRAAKNTGTATATDKE